MQGAKEGHLVDVYNTLTLTLTFSSYLYLMSISQKLESLAFLLFAALKRFMLWKLPFL